MDDLAREFSINKATVRQAITELSLAGLIHSMPARGTFVTDRRSNPGKRNTARSLSIGWVLRVADEGNTGRYHTEIMDAIRSALQEIRGNLIIISPDDLGKYLKDRSLDGAVLIGAFQRETIRHLAHAGMPIVLLDDTCRGADVDCILVDNRGGGYQAARHLLSLGHRQLAFVTGPADLQITTDRLAGAMEAIQEAGLDKSSAYVVAGDFAAPGGYRSFMDLLSRRPRPTGIFFFNDEMASGALQALYEHTDLRVPADFSFVGFDDISWASLTHPPLTTVHVEKTLMGREAVDRLRRHLDSRNHVATTTIVPTRLVIRKSTGQAPIQKGRN